MLKFRVEGQKLTYVNPDEVIVAGTRKYLECCFEFDGDTWRSFDRINVFFRNGRDNPVQILLDENGRITRDRGLCLSAGEWSVYLCATTYTAVESESGETIEEIDRQITSSSVCLRVLSHGQLDNATNSTQTPDIANQYIAELELEVDKAVKEIEQRLSHGSKIHFNLIEEPDVWFPVGDTIGYLWEDGVPPKKFDNVRNGDIVIEPGSKRVWQCTNDEGSHDFMCMAAFLNGVECVDFSDVLGIDDVLPGENFYIGKKYYKVNQGDIFIDSYSGKIFKFINTTPVNTHFVCVANFNGKGGAENIRDGEAENSLEGADSEENPAIALGEGCVSLGDGCVSGCMGYYIQAIDFDSKKIYLTDTKVNGLPTVGAGVVVADFATPAYEVNAKFSIINSLHYPLCGSIIAIENNVVTYDGNLGFTAFENNTGIDGHVFYVPTQPTVGVVSFVTGAVTLGDGNINVGKCAFVAGRDNSLFEAYGTNIGRGNTTGYASVALGRNNSVLGQSGVGLGFRNSVSAYAGVALGEDNVVKGRNSSAFGVLLKAYGDEQSVRGRCNIPDPDGKYIDIVGNGLNNSNPSNAYTLDRDGNARFAEKVYVECENGIGKGKELATKEDVAKMVGTFEPLAHGTAIYDTGYPLFNDVYNASTRNYLSDGDIRYLHLVPSSEVIDEETASLTIDRWYGTPIGIQIPSDVVYVKLLFKTNWVGKPQASMYKISDIYENLTAEVNGYAENDCLGNGNWETVIIPLVMPKGAVSARQISIRPGGRTNLSSFQEGSYFDVAAWAVLDNYEIAESFDMEALAAGLPGLGMKNIVDLYKTIAEKVEYQTYGVSIDLSNSNPETSVTYTDDAVGMVAGSSDWYKMSIFNKIKPCLFKNGAVVGYLNPDNFAQFEDGTEADITSGDSGDVMIEIPKTGYKISKIGSTLTVQITDDPNKNGFSYKAHTRTQDGDREKLYIGAFLGSEKDDKLRSVSGVSPLNVTPLTNFRTFAKANGTDYDLFAFYPLTLLQSLYLIMYKNLNSQAAIGMGYVGADSYAMCKNTGSTVAKGMCYGSADDTMEHMKFLGIEDFWGNLYQWIDGIATTSDCHALVATDNFNDAGDGYTDIGLMGTSDIGGYIKAPQGNNDAGFIISEKGGSSSTYFSDYANFFGGYLPVFGGCCSDGANAGAFQMMFDFTPTSLDPAIGARLMFL